MIQQAPELLRWQISFRPQSRTIHVENGNETKPQEVHFQKAYVSFMGIEKYERIYYENKNENLTKIFRPQSRTIQQETIQTDHHVLHIVQAVPIDHYVLLKDSRQETMINILSH